MNKILLLDIGDRAQEAVLETWTLKAQGYRIIAIAQGPWLESHKQDGDFDAAYESGDYRTIINKEVQAEACIVVLSSDEAKVKEGLELGLDARLYEGKSSLEALIELKRFIVNSKTYLQVRLLGHGKGGYSYLAKGPEGNVVVKQINNESCGKKIEKEISDYNRLVHIGMKLPRLLESDLDQEIIVKEFIDGPSAASLASEGKLEQWMLEAARGMSQQAQKESLDLDWDPTNFIVLDHDIYYVDYECNAYDPKRSLESWGMDHWLPRQAVSLLAADLSSSDVEKGYRSFLLLTYISRKGPQAFFLKGLLHSLLDGRSSFVRTRAFTLLACNAIWDEEQSYDLDKLFRALQDPSPIAVRKAIEAFSAVKRYQKRSLEEIRKADFSNYKDTMRPLLEADRKKAISLMAKD